MLKEIYLAGGCFWGVEKYLSCIQGVKETQAGYANGQTENPSYEEVCTRHTGHAEAVKVIYDTQKIDLLRLLELFYQIIDPTTLNRQGPDRGIQYRSGVYCTQEEDKEIIEMSLKTLQKNYEKPLVVEVATLENYYTAEEYHQKYLDKNPYGYCYIGKDAFERVRNST